MMLIYLQLGCLHFQISGYFNVKLGTAQKVKQIQLGPRSGLFCWFAVLHPGESKTINPFLPLNFCIKFLANMDCIL